MKTPNNSTKISTTLTLIASKTTGCIPNLISKYEGMFYDDNKEGTGTLYLTNGEKYYGQFQKDFVNGSG